jgi:formate--tetrahydrofolate ligase
MEDINLHFTGDFHAIGAANNLLAAMLDNHIFQGKLPEIAQNSITWNRAMDMNDRALRNIRIGTNGPNQNYVRESGFDITAASEVMAIFCLATSLKDLKTRLGNIIVGYTVENHQPIFARDLNAHGAMTALLKDALQPNLVQTLENNIALIHGGPFANIAHGCNSVIATKTALKLADYVVAEAGFGADLGAEKFINIKCRKTGLQPAAIILVATVRSIKYHGGIDANNLNVENIDALVKGFANLDQHIFNIRNHYGLPCIVCINHFKHDSDKEIKLLIDHIDTLNCQTFVSRHWANGSDGAIDLAKAVIDLVDNKPGQHQYVYQDSETIWQKIESVATKIYGASSISASKEIRDKIDGMDKLYGDYPICIAKTQMSFSTNPNLRGAPKGHNIEISNVRVSNGAGFIVVIAGNVLTMPGLPKIPAAENIDVDEQGQITGLF